ncbi:MAG: DUF2191 domain-containing protein [Deltaproteobacteria bacterium]|nr:DUF2191 domain-containing protein [Deltaproteobacteria bacterium]
MRTTIRMDDGLLRQAKTHAARTGRTLTALISDAVREALARGRTRPRRCAVRLTTFRGPGVCPGADLDDSASLLDLMERHDASP